MRKYTAKEVDCLQRVLRYEPESGKFFWINPRGTKVRVGDEAGTISSGFFRSILFDGRLYRCHRLAYAWVHGEYDGQVIHIDGDRQNNAIANLRLEPRQKPKRRAETVSNNPRPITKEMISDLKSYISYDSETGVFTYTQDRGRATKGSAAGNSRRGYVRIKYNGDYWLAHRVALAWDKGFLESDLVADHINGNGLDNRLCNLRLATPSQNSMNTKVVSSNSGIKGVSFDERFGCYNAQVILNGKPITGRFKTRLEAENWTRRTREDLHKQFANHGAIT